VTARITAAYVVNRPSAVEEESKLVVIAAIAANVVIATAKFTAAVVTRSSAMLSEGIHSLIDSGDGCLLLLGAHLGSRPPDESHPFGHGREVYFWSFVVAVMIFAVGGGVSMYEGVLRVLHPEPLRSAVWTFAVLGVSFIFEGTSFLIAARHFAKLKKPGVSALAAIRRSRNPSDFMIVLEDSAALIGILIAAAGVTLELVTGNAVFDGAASITIGLLLCVVATLLAIQTRGLLVGEGLLSENAAAIRSLIESDAAVERAAPPLSSYLGPETVVMNVRIRFCRDLRTDEIEDAVERIQQAIRERHPIVKKIFIAPGRIEP